jgi:4-hydroxyphenylacetate 3-monooxygenase
MIKTGEQYLESIRDGRRVYCDGELIKDLTTNPKTSGYAHMIAQYYDLHHDPENQDLLTFVDEDGERYAKHWMLPKSKEDLVERRKYHEFFWHHSQVWTRPPASTNTVMYTLIDDPEVWEEQSTMGGGRPFAQNIRDCWELLRREDRTIAPMFLDVQYDRSDPDSVEETPMLKIIEETDDGVVVRGWKAIGTSVVFANEIEVGILWKPGTTPEQVIFGMVPVNHPGVTHVTRRSNARDGANEYDHPLTSCGDELDSMAFFDDVVIPWERVWHLGNPEHAMQYPQRVFDWIHTETQTRHVTNAELIAGLAILVTESLGTNNAPIVMSQVADMVRFRETCRAFTIAAEDTGFITPGGLYKPNNIFIDFGRAYYLENIAHMIDELIDLCGRAIVIHPSEADFDNPDIGPKLASLFRGPGISARDRTKIFKFIHERFLTDWASRQHMFEKFNGTPLFVIRLLTMQRVEYASDGPLVELARKMVGLGNTEELAARANAEQDKYYPAAKHRPDYIKKQDVKEETVG